MVQVLLQEKAEFPNARAEAQRLTELKRHQESGKRSCFLEFKTEKTMDMVTQIAERIRPSATISEKESLRKLVAAKADEVAKKNGISIPDSVYFFCNGKNGNISIYELGRFQSTSATVADKEVEKKKIIELSDSYYSANPESKNVFVWVGEEEAFIIAKMGKGKAQCKSTTIKEYVGAIGRGHFAHESEEGDIRKFYVESFRYPRLLGKFKVYFDKYSKTFAEELNFETNSQLNSSTSDFAPTDRLKRDRR